MKKVISMILSLIILCSFISCGNNNQSNNDNNTPTNISPSLTTSHTHSYSPATCQNPKTCTACGQTEGETIAHDSVDGKCSMCGLDYFEELGRIIQENGEPYSSVRKGFRYKAQFTENILYPCNLVAFYYPDDNTITLYFDRLGEEKFWLFIDRISVKLQEYEWESTPESFANKDISGIIDAKSFSRNSKLKCENNTFIPAAKGEEYANTASFLFTTLFLESIFPEILEKSDYDITVGHFGFIRFE